MKTPASEFHGEGPNGDFTNPGAITLAQIAATNKTGGGTWGDASIPYIRLGAGSGGSGNGAFSAYADDLIINPSPEPVSMLVTGCGVLGLLLFRKR